jgi:hypothetical protein
MEKASHKVFRTSLLVLLAFSILAPAIAADKIESTTTAVDKHPYTPVPFTAEITTAHPGTVPPKSVSTSLIDQMSKVKNEAPFRHGMHYMAP